MPWNWIRRQHLKKKEMPPKIELSSRIVNDAVIDLVTIETEQIFSGLKINKISSRPVMELVTERYATIQEEITTIVKEKWWSYMWIQILILNFPDPDKDIGHQRSIYAINDSGFRYYFNFIENNEYC